MRRYIAQRIVIGLIILAGISLISFALVSFLPGDPVTARYPNITAEERERTRERLALNDPLPQRYVAYVQAIFRGDWGTSYNTGREVTQDFGHRLPASLELATYSMLTASAIGIPLGVVAALHRRRALDSAIRLLTSSALSIPVFWSSLLLIYLFFFLVDVAPAPVGRLPVGVDPPEKVTGFYSLDALITGQFSTFWSAMQQLVLPVVALTLFLLGPITRITRAAMIETLQERYILAARAFGVPERTILFGDALRNSFLSVITMIGVLAAYLITGDALVEKVFSWPGVGLYMVNAVVVSDHAPIQGGLLMIAVATLSINLALDIVYAILDPRIRVQYQIQG